MKSTPELRSVFRLGLVLACIVLATTPVNSLWAGEPELDPTFASTGKVLTDFSGNPDGGSDVALQPDGKIIVAGLGRSGATDATSDFALARYNSDGSLDSDFGSGGMVTTDFEGNFDIATAVTLQADGKIVAAGRSLNATGTDFALARYNSDGSLDPTFGPNHDGKVRTVFPSGISRAYDVEIQADQKIVAAGWAAGTNVTDFALARYNTDGSLDASFGSGGIVTTNFITGVTAYALFIQPDQKLIAAGTNGNFLLARYDTNGTLDTTFGPDGTGMVRTVFGDNFSAIFSLAQESGGALVAAGTAFVDVSGIDSGFALARYTRDGILDQNFGTNGTVLTNLSSSGEGARSVVLPADGSIIAGGYRQPGNDSDFVLIRYLSDGSLDSSFGAGGIVATDFGGDDSCEGLVLQLDGKLVAGGGGNGDFAVARFLLAAGSTAQPLNISTRAEVGTGDNVLIGGFIITGNAAKQVILRAIGPSLPVDGVLADPVLELHQADGTVITNDNWRDSQEAEITATGLAPTNDLESAIVATLTPGVYTAVVSGQSGGTGVGLVEAYDLQSTSDSQLANISTRGSVGTDDNVMIGGFILGGSTSDTTVVVRGLGPSLGTQGVAGTLADPTIDLYDSEGALLASNDNWQDTQKTELEASGLAPTDPNEAAILMPLSPGAYTTILRGKGNTTGVGLVEAYNLPPMSAVK